MTHVFAPHWFKNCVNSRTLTDSQTWGQFPAGPSREPLPSRAQVPVLALAIVEAGEELHAQSGKGLRRQENMNTCIASRWQQKVSKTGSRILEPGSLDPWSWIYDFDARLGILQCVSGIMVAAGLTAVEFWRACQLLNDVVCSHYKKLTINLNNVATVKEACFSSCWTCMAAVKLSLTAAKPPGVSTTSLIKEVRIFSLHLVYLFQLPSLLAQCSNKHRLWKHTNRFEIGHGRNDATGHAMQPLTWSWPCEAAFAICG